MPVPTPRIELDRRGGGSAATPGMRLSGQLGVGRMVRQRRAARLAEVLDLFERLTAVRTVLQAATLAAVVWALAARLHSERPFPDRGA